MRRRYASALYAVVVCPSIRLSQVVVLLQRLNVGSRKERRVIAEGFWFSDADRGRDQMLSTSTHSASIQLCVQRDGRFGVR